MLLVQLGINSTSDVWKFCQNWTSRRGESNLANFQTSLVLLISNCTRHRMITYTNNYAGHILCQTTWNNASNLNEKF